MITRPRVRARSLKASCHTISPRQALQRCSYATIIETTPSVSPSEIHNQPTTIQRHPPTAPPAHKPAFLRKSQLHRQYASLIRSTPLMLLFQHNNLKANEWAAIRRELNLALQKASASSSSPSITPDTPDPATSIKLQTIQKGVFGAALRVVEFYKPDAAISTSSSTNPSHQTSTHSDTEPNLSIPPLDQRPSLGSHSHSLSRTAYLSTLKSGNPKRLKPTARWKYDPRPSAHRKKSTALHKLLHGPIALLKFPTVTPAHLSAALSVLAPTPGAASAFPAPRRRVNPGFYEPAVQGGLGKLILLGARVEGRTMDGEGVRWVGGLAKSGGLEGLRSQLVGMLAGVGGGVTGALEGAGKSLWVTMEARRIALEEGGNDGGVGKSEEKGA